MKTLVIPNQSKASRRKKWGKKGRKKWGVGDKVIQGYALSLISLSNEL